MIEVTYVYVIFTLVMSGFIAIMVKANSAINIFVKSLSTLLFLTSLYFLSK